MKILWSSVAWDDFVAWDADTRDKIIELIADIRRDPFKGLGKPEALKHHLQGWWSRRINQGQACLSTLREGRSADDRDCTVSAALLIFFKPHTPSADHRDRVLRSTRPFARELPIFSRLIACRPLRARVLLPRLALPPRC